LKNIIFKIIDNFFIFEIEKMFSILPVIVLDYILSFTDMETIISVSYTCKSLFAKIETISEYKLILNIKEFSPSKFKKVYFRLLNNQLFNFLDNFSLFWVQKIIEQDIHIERRKTTKFCENIMKLIMEHNCPKITNYFLTGYRNSQVSMESIQEKYKLSETKAITEFLRFEDYKFLSRFWFKSYRYTVLVAKANCTSVSEVTDMILLTEDTLVKYNIVRYFFTIISSLILDNNPYETRMYINLNGEYTLIDLESISDPEDDYNFYYGCEYYFDQFYYHSEDDCAEKNIEWMFID